MTGFCVLISIFALFWDAGEFSKIATEKRTVQWLEETGHVCQTSRINYAYKNVDYVFHECQCNKDNVTSKLRKNFIVCLLSCC